MAIVWALLVVIGAVWAALRDGKDDGVQTAVMLPQNTLLLPGTFTPPAMAMRYVVPEAGIAAHTRIDIAAVSPVPVLPSQAAGSVLAVAPAAWVDIQAGLNAGAAAKLCRDKAEVAPIAVVAVRCDAATPTRQCSATFTLPANGSAVGQLATASGLRVAPTC